MRNRLQLAFWITATLVLDLFELLTGGATLASLVVTSLVWALAGYTASAVLLRLGKCIVESTQSVLDESLCPFPDDPTAQPDAPSGFCLRDAVA